MHRNSWLMFERYGLPQVKAGVSVLEIGPDTIPSTYRVGTSVEVAKWDTLDLAPRPGLTYVTPDEYQLPIADNTYDLVLSGQVLEHVPKVWRFLAEVARVTRPGGIVITVAPVSWPFHEAPVDCWRCYPDGLRALYEDSGLETILAEWGSIELEPLVRRLPGRLSSPGLWERLAPFLLLMHERFRFPVQAAFDTIAIGRKIGG